MLLPKKKLFRLLAGLCLSFIVAIAINSCANDVRSPVRSPVSSGKINIGISSENLILEQSIIDLTRKATGETPNIVAKGSVSLTKLACSGQLDAIAIADDMWASIICPDAEWVNTSDSLYSTRIQFALPTTTAKKLGWQNRVVQREEILAALKSGELQLATTLPTHSNSGYNTLLWLAREEIDSNLAPEQVTPQTLEPLQPIYQNLAQSSESTSYLAEKLTSFWQDNTLAALYRFLYAPNGKALLIKDRRVSLPKSVSLIEVSPAVRVTPTWFVTTQNPELKQKLIDSVFEPLQDNNPQIFKQIEQLNPPLADNITRETTPRVEVHQALLNSFHSAIRQKRWIVGIIDGSGSMRGEGFNQLLSAFSEILEPEKAQENFLYSPDDRFSLVVYQGSGANLIPRGTNITKDISREKLWQVLSRDVRVNGGTPVRQGLLVGFQTALQIPDDYQIEIFLFTDGQFSHPVDNRVLNLYQQLQQLGAQFTVVGAGGVNARELTKLSNELEARSIVSSDARQTKEELLKAFREAQI